MPNHVSNKIIINGIKKEFQQSIVNTITTNYGDGKESFDNVDFRKLIPVPNHIYDFDLSHEDEVDFQSENCWTTWNRKNWGTKWNAYETKIQYGEQLIIEFQTAWSVPYPFIIALSKVISVQFKLKYYDEGGCFWGIDEWEAGKRTKRNRDRDEDKRDLCIELKGYDPEANDED